MSEQEDGVNERRVLVLDIPFGTTAEETADQLDEPYKTGFHIHRALEWPGGVRIIYVATKTPAKPRTDKLDGEATAKPTAAQTRESLAMAFLRDNRQMSATALAAAFKALGFVRSPAWITKRRAELIRVERRLGV